MNIEELNNLMNCICLQSVIQNDIKKFTTIEESNNIQYKYVASEKTNIIFECLTVYRHSITNLNTGSIVKNKDERDCCNIPFLYCPICGTKTKNIIEDNSFYAKLQIQK